MRPPRRLLEDHETDAELRSLLGTSAAARPLDDMTRRRLKGRLAKATALPALAAGWLFVKSAAAALSVVVISGTVATAVGVLPWPRATPVSPPRLAPARTRAPLESPRVLRMPAVSAVAVAPAAPSTAGRVAAFPAVAPSAGGSLAVESTLLERARREMQAGPALALQIAAEHARRFPRGQLASERTLIQVEALHRLGRDAEARRQAAPLLAGGYGGLYRERARQLLGESALP